MFEVTCALIERDDLINVLGGVPPSPLKTLDLRSHSLPWSQGHRDVIVGYWKTTPLRRQMPDFIVLREGCEREFFAWVDTYCAPVRPISQWCRVYSETHFRKVPGPIITSELRCMFAPWAGAIIGECISQLGGRTHIREIGVTATIASFTFPVARAKALWGDKIPRGEIIDRLSKSSMLLRASQRRLAPSQLEFVWSILSAVEDGRANDLKSDKTSQIICSACRDLREVGEISDQTIAEAGRIVPEFEKLRILGQLTAEARVELFDHLAESYGAERERNIDTHKVVEFFLAFLANRIGRRGTDHIGLLSSWIDKFPLSPMWYGITSALWRPELWGAEFGGLGRLVQRELQYPFNFTEKPRADLCFDELVALVDSESGEFIFDIRGAAVRTLNIEVAPGVVAGYSMQAPKKEEPGLQPIQLSHGQIAEIGNSLDTAIYGLTSLRNLLAQSVGVGGAGEHAEERKIKETPTSQSGKKKRTHTKKTTKKRPTDPKLI